MHRCFKTDRIVFFKKLFLTNYKLASKQLKSMHVPLLERDSTYEKDENFINVAEAYKSSWVLLKNPYYSPYAVKRSY